MGGWRGKSPHLKIRHLNAWGRTSFLDFWIPFLFFSPIQALYINNIYLNKTFILRIFTTTRNHLSKETLKMFKNSQCCSTLVIFINFCLLYYEKLEMFNLTLHRKCKEKKITDYLNSNLRP